VHSDIEKISGQIESATREYKAQHDKEQSPPVVNAVLRRPQSEIDEENARARRHEGRDSARLTVETIGLVLGTVLAIATIGQWIVTKEAVRIAAKSANAAERGAEASEKQVEATQASIHATVDAFRLDQRAWLGVNNLAIVVLKSGEPLRVDADIANTGKTPALNIRVANAGIQTNFGPLDVDSFIASGKLGKPKQPPSTDVIFPNSSAKIPFPTDQSLNDMLVTQINAHTLWVYVFGDIYYRDSFGGEHVTEFCGSYDPPTRRFNSCPKHVRAN
jgi:hypothetical protein